jgi:hypothetical protein
VTSARPLRGLRSAQRNLGIALIAFLVAVSLPYLWLVENFGYDDVLREPAAEILTRVAAGGVPLVLAWFAFAMGALLFVPVVLTVASLLRLHGEQPNGAMLLGIASAVAQSIGLLRWVLVVPPLAANYVEAATGPASKEALEMVFEAVHRYGGTVVGEMIGQLLLAGWTGLTTLQLWRARVVPRWLAAAGAATLPLWLVGQSELLHGVAPDIPSIEVVPIAFMAWEAWLAALAVSCFIAVWRGRRSQQPGAAVLVSLASASRAPHRRLF